MSLQRARVEGVSALLAAYNKMSFSFFLVLKKTFHVSPFCLQYCIEGVSETTCASADFYCQSNNDKDTRTSCAFYEKSLQVNHRQNTQKERVRYCDVEREREREETEREGMASVFIGDNYFWFRPSS